MLKERQATNRLDKLIYKFGPIQGYIKWYNRQQDWQITLNSKSEEEKKEINKKKSIRKYDFETYRIKMIDKLKKEAKTKNKKQIDFTRFLSKENYINSYVSKYKNFIRYFKPEEEYVNEIPYFQNEILSSIKGLYQPNEVFYNQVSYIKQTSEGLLRSSLEIEFYNRLKDNSINNFEIDKTYPDSKLRYDFYLKDFELYIEIAGNIRDEKYREKMNYKKEKFNALILTKNDFDWFFIEYLPILKGEQK